eukprot:snap_masked-scaffold_35-processed-gene-2.39-mRNA-1 protein AED:1.00 eAED:1.00 QI:0/0/0/0/1/1/4/0/121
MLREFLRSVRRDEVVACLTLRRCPWDKVGSTLKVFLKRFEKLKFLLILNCSFDSQAMNYIDEGTPTFQKEHILWCLDPALAQCLKSKSWLFNIRLAGNNLEKDQLLNVLDELLELKALREI